MKLLASPHRLHGAVSNAVVTDPRAERILWRLERDDPYRPHLLVLTASHPDFTQLVETYGWPDTPAGKAQTRDYQPLLDRLDTGQRYAFRLTANPVQSVRKPVKPTDAQQAKQKQWDASNGTGRKARGHRVAHRTVQQQQQWLSERALRCGFSLPPADTGIEVPSLGGGKAEPATQVVRRETVQFERGASGATVRISSATFEGILEVTDAAVLRSTLVGGVGPNKAYGQGLLTLAPLTADETLHG